MNELNAILQIKTFNTCFNSRLNCSNILQVCGVFSILVKDELAGCYKFMDELKNVNIIISTLAQTIFFKVDEALVDY